MVTESDDIYAALCMLAVLACVVFGTVLAQLPR